MGREFPSPTLLFKGGMNMLQPIMNIILVLSLALNILLFAAVLGCERIINRKENNYGK